MRSVSTVTGLVTLLASLCATAALGQIVPAAPAPAAPASATADSPSAEQVAAKDPMLAPLPPAPNQLHTWREALGMIRTQATSLAIARARVNEAQALARDALSEALPELTATGMVTHHLLYGVGPRFDSSGIRPNADIPDPGTIWQAGLELRQPLFAYRSWYDVRTGNEKARAAQQTTADVERQVLAAVAETLVDLVTAERLAQISREGLMSSLATLNLTERRANLGAASKLDVLRAEQSSSQTRSQVVLADEAVQRAREALGMALGSSQTWGVPPEIRLDSLALDARKLCTSVASIDERADVRAAVANSQVAERDRKSAGYDTLPTLDFVSNLAYSNQNNTANNKPLQWTIGALLTVPLYDGGSRYAQKDRASATAEIAKQELTQVKRQARLEAQRASRAVTVAQANLQVSTKTRDITQETARLAQVAFLSGSGTSFDLVDTQRQHREAELDLAIKELEVVRAQIAALLAQANCNI